MKSDGGRIKKGNFDYNSLDFSTSNVSNGSENKLQYNTFGQLISRARLEKKPLVVVEGKDDVPIYEQFAKKVNKKVRICAIETFSNYSEGCTHVKRFIEDAQVEINKSEENEKFIMGIVDRDASYYRDEINEMKCLLVLKAYSFESHFVTRKNLEYAVENYLSSNFGINEFIIDYIFKEYESSINLFYYYSLEALKNACSKHYKGIIGYSKSYGQIIRETDLPNKIMAKKEELDQYALAMRVPSDNPISIIKGKWLLDLFIDKTHESLLALSEFCSTDSVIDGQERCSFCQSGNANKCSWKPKKGFIPTIYRGFILQFFNEIEVDYIYERFKSLG
ncbi:DUF4435 domain-containing protein [Lederbergia citrea]|uniref:DUF4435 domain-containing protein n=1 Tax=Lederbergia citrea TaxID=2833581 RepID=UPI001BC93605|nr:DUF4435 domain-containing protein [Lederbergia citrea]MBS4206306.1 DUF4435 domain-containing protein [Lederbergia citrea]